MFTSMPSPTSRSVGIRRNSLHLISALLLPLLAGCASRHKLDAPLAHVSSIRSPEFRQTLGTMVSAGFVDGNNIRILNNGDEIFPAMLAAIRNAKRTINFETFVFYKGEIPRAFAEALQERANAGVKVNLLLDAVGAKKSRPYHSALRKAGVNLELYHRLFAFDFRSYNFRTHRKLLIVDGKIGFTGGVGIADEWNGYASSPKEWRDQHFRVEGPVVAQLQAAFNDNWFKTHHEILQGPDYFPAPSPAGSMLASAFISSPSERRSAVELMDHLAIASAQRSLMIESPYFLPSKAILEALCAAAQRGVHVQILMPGKHIDQKAVRRGSRKRWPRLLAAGVELYEFEPTMIHTKLLIADGLFVSIGSANFDMRSLRINDEANLNVLNAGFARQESRIFAADLLRAERVDKAGRDIKDVPQVPVETAQAPVESQL